jgi:hypothetical protein
MAEEPITDACVVCGADLPEDPPTVTVPSPVGARLSPLSSPGIRKLAFCSRRHRRDWQDARRGDWSGPETEDPSTAADPADPDDDG